MTATRRRGHVPRPLALVVLAVVTAGCLDVNPLRSSEARPAPDFTLTTIDGENVSLADYRGDLLVIDFMATWCQPCKRITPDLAKLQANHDVRILSISIDTTATEREKLHEFAEEHNATWPYAQDTDDVFLAYGGLQVPLLVFIDEEGVIRERAVDPSYEKMETLLYRTAEGA